MSFNQTRKYFSQKWIKICRRKLIVFSLLVLHRCGRTFRCTLWITWRPLRTDLWRGTQGVITAPLWTYKELFFTCKLLFYAWTEMKSLLSDPGHWGVEKHLQLPNSSFTVSTTKSPPCPPRNHPKAYQVNGHWWRNVQCL